MKPSPPALPTNRPDSQLCGENLWKLACLRLRAEEPQFETSHTLPSQKIWAEKNFIPIETAAAAAVGILKILNLFFLSSKAKESEKQVSSSFSSLILSIKVKA